MADLSQRIQIEFEDVEGVRGAVSPTLRFRYRLSSSGSRVEFDDMTGEIEFVSSDGVTRKQGPDLVFNRFELPSVQGSETVTAKVPLTWNALEIIEELRQGEKIEIRSTLRVSGRQHNTDNLETAKYDLSITLNEFEWSNILETIGYHDYRVSRLDMKLPDIRLRDTLAAAQANVEAAQNKHDSGDYPGAIVDCRTAVERIQTIEDDIEDVMDERKASELMNILGPFEKGFLGGQAHADEKTGVETALRRDSDLAIGLTKCSVRYVSTAFEEELESE